MSKMAKVYSTDVLVIGGGIAALSAANKAAEQGASVIIADKSTAGWSGQMPLSGGVFICVPPDKVDLQTTYYVTEGEYLNDQEFTEAFVRAMYPSVKEVADWGVWSFEKDYDGKVVLNRGGIARVPQREMMMPMLLDRAFGMGTKTLNKVYIADLLKNNGRVVGAVGFHYHTGDFYVIKARATIMACGGCMYKSRGLWHTNCGEGVAMAYNAGAELRSAEFGNMFHISNKYTKDDGGGTINTAWTLFENADGEMVLEKYPDVVPPKESTPPWMRGRPSRVVRGFLREYEAGKGPIYWDISKHPDVLGQAQFSLGGNRRGALQHGYGNKLMKAGLNIAKKKVEWEIVPEFHEGPVRVDLNCKTTVPGLYATGDTIAQGSACFGAIEFIPGGTPLAFAMITGFWAGTDAGKAAASTPEPELSSHEVERLRKQMYAPMGIEKGYSPYDAIKEVQENVFKLKNTFLKSKDRLEKALLQIEEVREKLPTLMARDSHELVRCHEAMNMVPCAEFLYRASLMRTETRTSHIREDYPEQDDKNWLKWVIVKRESGKMAVSTEPVPIDKYKFKPHPLR